MATVNLCDARGLEVAIEELELKLKRILIAGKFDDLDMDDILKLAEDIDYAWAHS